MDLKLFFRSASIVLNSDCNTNCVFCFFHSDNVKHPKNEQISKEFFEKLIQRLDNFKPNLKIHSDGEPLKHPQLWEFINFARDKVSSIEVLTNLREKNIVNNILQGEVDALLINLPAANNEDYIKHRPGDTEGFDIVLNNLKELKSKKLSINPLVILSQVLTKYNSDQKSLEDYIDLAKSLGAFKIKFTKMIGVKRTENLIPSSPPNKQLRDALIERGETMRVEFDEFPVSSNPRTECSMTAMVNLDETISYCCKLRDVKLEKFFSSDKELAEEIKILSKKHKDRLCEDCM